jgi:hypothetical protein
MRKQISNISIHQTSKVLTVLYVAIGLIFIPMGVVMILAGQQVVGIVYVLMPFIYGIIGYPLIAAICWLYNMIAKSLGGIEFTIEDSLVETMFSVRCPACGELGKLRESNMTEKIECPKCKRVFLAATARI